MREFVTNSWSPLRRNPEQINSSCFWSTYRSSQGGIETTFQNINKATALKITIFTLESFPCPLSWVMSYIGSEYLRSQGAWIFHLAVVITD